ncbi:MAG: outer membrane protein transport protein [Tannerella sp.]|nr:outer membrane protein transport protein [Tannerella sp.]
MKKTGISITMLLLSCGMLFAQGKMDAYRFSQSDLDGTARSMSMGGAFGALGGDMSAMSHNPAGLGVYRSSEVQTTLDLNNANIASTWTGMKSSATQTKFSFDNFSYVGYFPTGNDQGIKGWDIGFSYNKVKDFNRSYKAMGTPAYSMADFTAAGATGAYVNENDLLSDDNYDPYYNSNISWLSILGYESGFFGTKYGVSDVYHSAFGQQNGNTWVPYSPNETTLRITEKGSISEYNFSMATNISDIVFIGATLGVTDLNYRMYSQHDESFGGNDYLYLSNNLETEGSGYSVNVGVIVRPVDAFRLGVAYNSPKWYKMTDYFFAEGETNISSYAEPKMQSKTPDGQYAEYALRTPGRWIFSAAGIIGTTALISVDYEITDYKSMFLSDRGGIGYDDNTYIEKEFGIGQTLKLGGEVKVTPQFAVRAGYIWQPTPMKSMLTSSNRDELVSVPPVGTTPHYTVSNETNYYTVGLGYRFTPNFYMDLACIHRVQSEKLYPFSNTFEEDAANHIEPVVSEPAKLSVKTTRFALTFGYKF